MAMWKLFGGDLNLHEAKQTRFKSLHECFIRELKPGARSIDQNPEVLVSPSDGIVGASGLVHGTEVFQAKGFPYSLGDLIPDRELVEHYRDGVFVTLRLKSSMYHRFHAPCSGVIREVTYISGDTWNVNPIALQRIEKLYCKNERAVITLELDRPGQTLTLVPVAAILVASIRLQFMSEALNLKYRGPNRIPCNHFCSKGEELGYFEHGSTIIVFARKGFRLSEQVKDGAGIKMGEPLFLRPD